MIQRIQTIFLLLASLSAGAVFLLPFAASASTEKEDFFTDGIYNIYDDMGLMAIYGIAALLLFVTIFLFNNRSSQMRVIGYTLGFLVTAISIPVFNLIYFDYFPGINIKVGLFLPLLAIILGYLANRNINKDEELVKSMDRLR